MAQSNLTGGWFGALGALAWALAGCAVAPENAETEPVAKVDEPIINGTDITVDSLGTPALWNTYLGGYCSSTLLSDGWILTAHHCLTNEDATTGGTPTDPTQLQLQMQDGTWLYGDSSWTVYLHPTLDVGLVHFTGTSLLNPAGRPWGNPLYLGPSSTLVGQSVYCQGWGRNTHDGGRDTLRYAWIPITGNATPPAKGFAFKDTTQIPWLGDSGSSCFVYNNGQWNIISVQSAAWDVGCPGDACRVYLAYEIGVEYFRDWVESVIGNAAVVYSNQYPETSDGGTSQLLLPGGPLYAPSYWPNGYASYDLPQLTIGNDTIRSIRVPSLWQVELYQHAGFVGNIWIFSDEYRPTLVADLDAQASSIKVLGGVRTSYDALFSSGGTYSLAPTGINDLITNIMVPAGWQATVFDNSDCTGDNATFSEGTYNTLGSMNYRTSCLRIVEPAAVYLHNDYSGTVSKFTADCYDVGRLGLPNESISSVFVPQLRAVQLFWNAGMTGSNIIYGPGQSQASLGSWNDAVSSLCVYSMPPATSGSMLAGDALGNTAGMQSAIGSTDGQSWLVMQSDGNLVVYRGSTALWATCTYGLGGQIATLQSDGNFVLYDTNHRALWSSHTAGNPGATLTLGNDGVLSLDRGATRLWSSSTFCH